MKRTEWRPARLSAKSMTRVCVAGMLCLAAATVRATDFVWTGGAGDGTWTAAANWDPGSGYPQNNADTATINASLYDITVPAATTVGALSVGGTFTSNLFLNGTLTVSSAGGQTGDLTLNAGTMLTTNNAAGDISVSGTLAIGSGATCTVRRTSIVGDGTGKTITAGVLTIASGGLLSANGQGFDKASGPGAGTSGGSGGYNTSCGSGGSHGGRGGYSSQLDAGADPYGSFSNPTSLGSGGGGTSYGGAGGGAITLVVAGTLTVDGVLSAEGALGTSGYRGGGGAGGTLNITADTLAGSGTISVRGANGRYTDVAGGGGGGGRLDVSAVATWSFGGTVTAAGGWKGAEGASNFRTAARGHAGTIDWPANFSLTLGNGAGETLRVVMGYDGVSGCDFGSGTLRIKSGGTLEVDGDPTVNGGYGCGGGPTISAAVVTIDSGGVLKADGLGFDTDRGVGAGIGSSVGGGGGHGGAGGRGGYGATTYAGGITNDSPETPAWLGSGGGHATDTYGHGGKGGGALILNVAGALTVNGTLSANGTSNSLTCGSGSGAGGTIRITAASLAGSGLISATGADGTYAGSTQEKSGGGGGGGRIDVSQVAAWSFGGSLTVAGGRKGGEANTMLTGHGSRGFAGTIHWPANFSLTLGTGGTGGTNVVMGTDGVWPYDFGAGSLTIHTNGLLTVDGDPLANGTDGGGTTIAVANATIDLGGALTATAMGFDSQDGPGLSTNVIGATGGAAYGGAGGNGGSGGGSINVYGSATNPVALGSGAGFNTSSRKWGGKGGGAIMLRVTDTLTVNGTLTADGGQGTSGSTGAGGGSGGTLNITATHVTGTTGRISAGGGAGSANNGGGGGGGRIAIRARVMDFSGTTNYLGGVKHGTGLDGSAGTYVFILLPNTTPPGMVFRFR